MGKSGKARGAAAKRFKITGGGKVVRRHGSVGHLLTKKSRKRKRTLGSLEVASKGDAKTVREMLQGRS